MKCSYLDISTKYKKQLQLFTILWCFLQQATVLILLILSTAAYNHPTWCNGLFCQIWWVALGWVAAKAIVGIKQGYDGLALYRDVLVNEKL